MLGVKLRINYKENFKIWWLPQGLFAMQPYKGPARTRAKNLKKLIPIVLHHLRHTLLMTLRNWCSAGTDQNCNIVRFLAQSEQAPKSE